jgi:hypothetical protein
VGNDPGCYDLGWTLEDPKCNNGVDDDGDTFIDLADPQCNGYAWQNYEVLSGGGGCGLLGPEALALAGVLAVLRRRRRS